MTRNDKQKLEQFHRPALSIFVTGWMATHLVALLALIIISIPFNTYSRLHAIYSDIWPLIFAGSLSILQFLWLRRSWGITLRLWLPLALLGVIVGEFAFQIFDANVVYPFPPKLYSGSRAMPEPEHIMQMKYKLYETVRWFLLWSTPLIIQWLALRQRFAGHGLWLVAAVVHAPLTYFIAEHGGITIHALKFFDQFTEVSLIRDAQPLGSLLAFFDLVTPTALMGLALYALLARNVKTRVNANPS
ncbi:MAG: hypothetical protein OXI34_07745 [Chloroflexota bacterium]|nr:hypothetical protein [Chloroflexota bacterium]MDE2947722.1 hypothetical protein [Chloroflexota bacterium]